MGRGHLDRCGQRRHHRRQRGAGPRQAAQGILGDGLRAGAVEADRQERSQPRAVQLDQCRADRHLRRARLLRPARPSGAAVATGASRSPELLRHGALEEDAGAPGRFRPHQRPEDPPVGRRGRRHLRQLQIFRQLRAQEARQENRPGAHHGLRRAAARLSLGDHRRRALLGRRHRLQHPARLRARCRARPRHADLPGRPVFRRAAICRPRCWRPPSARRTSAIPAARG